jgi:aspartate-alanine antiporter
VLIDQLRDLFSGAPELALFVSLALGYLIGKVRLGPVSLGGVAGTLIVAIVIGQLGVTISDDAKNIAFATFIFALGFTAGPQFFAHLDRQGLTFGVFTLIEAVTVLALVVAWTVLLGLDPGTASGLLAGSATESAVVGTAADAIAGLPIDAATAATWQANVATAYSLSYLFGLITIVLFTSQIAPALMRTDLRAIAAGIWERMGGGPRLAAGEVVATPDVVGRVFRIEMAAGLTVAAIESRLGDARVERVQRGEDAPDPGPDLLLSAGDVVLLVGRRAALVDAAALLGPELDDPLGRSVALETREIWLTAPAVAGRSIGDIRDRADPLVRRGIFLVALTRGDQRLPALPETVVQQGDVLTVTGTRVDLDRVTGSLGRTVPRTTVTDFVYLGAGAALGILIGRISFDVGSVAVSIGTGVGCLLTGLVFGWLHARRPVIGNYPPAAAAFAKDFGLATFIAAVGLSVGPQAAVLLGQYGLALPVAGVLNVIVPAGVSLLIGARLLRTELPILLGAIAGQQCSTPAGNAVVDRAGNTVPMLGYTVTYALSSVLLPLLGPVVVLITYRM